MSKVRGGIAAGVWRLGKERIADKRDKREEVLPEYELEDRWARRIKIITFSKGGIHEIRSAVALVQKLQ